MRESDSLAVARRNKANYLAAKDAFNRGDIDACIAHYAPRHRVMSPHGESDRAGIRAFLEDSRRGWPDLRLVVEHAVAEDDWVMGRCVATATHATPVLGVPPTQQRVETTFWDLHRFDDEGLIVETWNLMDRLAILGQLGLLPKAQ